MLFPVPAGQLFLGFGYLFIVPQKLDTQVPQGVAQV